MEDYTVQLSIKQRSIIFACVYASVYTVTATKALHKQAPNANKMSVIVMYNVILYQKIWSKD